MATTSVYLHIPKSAGSSHRAYLSKVYGERNIFWYGLHSESDAFNAREVEGVPALGGHKTLSFYPRSLDALYSSVIRDPVARAISLYNYYTSPPEAASAQWSEKLREAQQTWQDLGVDPASLTRSIENCEAFRLEVSNVQCGYLSRYGATLEGVKRSMQESNMVIGVFEQLSRFNSFFQEECGFPMENRSRANSARAGYSSAILEEDGVIELLRSINKEDQALYDFIRLAHDGLYVGASNIKNVRDRVPIVEERAAPKVDKAVSWDSVHLFSKGLLSLAEGGKVIIPLIIKNQSKCPVSLSSEGDVAIAWRVQTIAGEPLEGLQGVLKADQWIPAQASRGVRLVLDASAIELPDSDTLFMQFGLFHAGEWLWDKYPLNSTWAKIHV